MTDTSLSLEQKQAVDTSLTDYFRAVLGKKLLFTLKIEDHHFAADDQSLGVTFDCNMTRYETILAERALKLAIHHHPVLKDQEYSIGTAEENGITTGIVLMVKASGTQQLNELADTLAVPVTKEIIAEAQNSRKRTFENLLVDAGNIARYHGIF